MDVPPLMVRNVPAAGTMTAMTGAAPEVAMTRMTTQGRAMMMTTPGPAVVVTTTMTIQDPAAVVMMITERGDCRLRAIFAALGREVHR